MKILVPPANRSRITAVRSEAPIDKQTLSMGRFFHELTKILKRIDIKISKGDNQSKI